MTYPQPTAPVDRQVNGVLTGVEPRQGGWHRFAILEPNMQYPVRADTKLTDIVNQALSLMGQPVSANVRESIDPSRINPNSGRPYVNRHLQAISPQGFAPGVQPNQGAPTAQQWQQQPQQPVQTPQQTQTWQQPVQAQQPVQQAPVQQYGQQDFTPGLQQGSQEKDVNVMRQCASKVAAQMIGILPPEQQTMQGLVALCEAWMAYYVYGPLRFGVTAFTSDEGQQSLDGATDPNDPDAVYARTGVCPECGHSDGDHAPGCPRDEILPGP